MNPDAKTKISSAKHKLCLLHAKYENKMDSVDLSEISYFIIMIDWVLIFLRDGCSVVDEVELLTDSMINFCKCIQLGVEKTLDGGEISYIEKNIKEILSVINEATQE